MPTNTKTKKPTSLLDKIKQVLTTDRAILMICIGIAFIFWLFTKLSEEYKSAALVKMVYKTPKNKIFSVPPPSDIEVELKGTGWELLSIHFKNERPSIELEVTEDILAENPTVSLESRIYKLFPRATVLDIRPNIIQLALEENATKVVPIQLDQQIELAPLHGFVDSIHIQPQQVQISGPASIVRDIHAWKTVPLILQQVRGNIRQKLALQRHPNGNVLFFPAEVQCEARIEAMTEKKLEVPVEIRNVGDSTINLSILPKKVEVACMVVLSRYEQLKPEDFEVYIDFKNDQMIGADALKVRLAKAPTYTQQVHFYPRTVDYIVRNKEE